MLFFVFAGVAVVALFGVAAVIDLRDRGQKRFDPDSRRPATSRRRMRRQLRQRAAMRRRGVTDVQSWEARDRGRRRTVNYWD